MSARRCWWLPVAAAGLSLTLGAGTAAPQTVVVKDAAPGSAVEVVVNAARAAEATVGADGLATLELGAQAAFGRATVDARVLVDTCAGLRRVLLVERTQALPAGGACVRTAIADFRIGPETTMLVEVGGAVPIVRVRQGPLPPLWLLEPAAQAAPPVFVPAGFVLSGALAISSLGNAEAAACGGATFCDPAGAQGSLAFGATYWFTPYLGADVGVHRLRRVETRGSELAYSFRNFLDARLVTVAARVGVPLQRVRVYGLVGAGRHWAMSTTTQDVEIIGASGDDRFRSWASAFQTGGWDWVAGGGAEVWPLSRYAIYSEFGRAPLASTAPDGESRLDDRLTYVTAGVRLRVGR